ncbi:hypothetical protein RAE21_19005 [Rhodoferax sp. TBRC 17198]|uniref:hypothetical protein n=1 Tax=Rhodoferax potami TaxID=3068338 RepID=UPI0028BF2DA1|nr:hypothetical protein [Rhodoferax sp. TBRC 17198]MDT7524440.1 hypothetical protein [Rhodoferax sp. TBRC 17198]
MTHSIRFGPMPLGFPKIEQPFRDVSAVRDDASNTSILISSNNHVGSGGNDALHFVPPPNYLPTDNNKDPKKLPVENSVIEIPVATIKSNDGARPLKNNLTDAAPMQGSNVATRGLEFRFGRLFPAEQDAFIRLKQNTAFLQALDCAVNDENITADHLSRAIAQARAPHTLNAHHKPYGALALTNLDEIAVLKKLMNRSSLPIFSNELKEREKVSLLNRVLRDTAAPPVRAFEKRPPGECYIISFDDGNSVIRSGAKTKALRNQIPTDNCFYSGTVAPNRPSGKPLLGNSLENLGLESRLTLIGHASENRFNTYAPKALAEKLRDAGLKEAGILKLEGCNVGKGDYLEKLKIALDELDIKVGYLSGPKSYHANTDEVIKTPFGRKAFDVLFLLKLIAPPMWPYLFTSNVTGSLPGTHLKIVKGNADITFPGTHYDLVLSK